MERILVLGLSKERGGIENYIFNTTERISSSDVGFDFLVKEQLNEEFYKRVNSMEGTVFVAGTFRKNIFKVWKSLCAFYKKNQYRKIYINLSYAPTLIYIIPALWNKVETVYIHSHASDDIRYIRHVIFRKLFFDIILRKVKCVYMGCSVGACEWMYGKRICDNYEQIIVNNAVDYNRFMYKPEMTSKVRSQYKLNDNFVIGHVGRFGVEKNHTFLIQAFYELQKNRENVRLLLVGNGPLRGEIEQLVEHLGITDKVVFVGETSQVSDFYNAMDCFWLPSIYEGFPMVAVEAQVNGLRCVFSDKISKKIDIMGNNIFADILDVKSWVNAVNEFPATYDRKVNRELVSILGYDLDKEVEKVRKVLLE